MFSTPFKEIRRASIIDRLELMKLDSNPQLNDLAMLAAFVCNTPVALLNVVHPHGQHAAAAWGMEPIDVPIESSICNVLINSDSDTLFIENATQNPDFRDGWAVKDMGLQFYAGAQMTSANGVPLGALCVIDKVNRTIAEQELYVLRLLAKQASRLMEQRLAPVFKSMNRPTAEDVILATAAGDFHSVLTIIERWLPRMTQLEGSTTRDTSRITALFEEHFAFLLKDLHGANSENVCDLTRILKSPLIVTSPVHRVEINIDDRLLVRGNELDLRQVFTELLDNAFKFSPRGGEIRIDVDVVGDKAAVRVSDNGVGIQSSADIFAKGVQGEGIAGRTSGEGEGLHAVYSLLSACDAPVAAWTTPVGTTIGFVLTRAKTTR